MTSFLKLRLPGLVILFVAAFSLTAQACCPPVLLTIDVSNPSSVIITSTGAFSGISDSSTTEGDGIDLLQFFTSSVQVTDPVISGGLIPSGGSLAYDSFLPDNASDSYNFQDLNLYNSSNTVNIQQFLTSASAFTGSWTIDLSLFSSSLPSVGTYGDIMVGFSGARNGTGDTIGQWEIISAPVPEPSQYGFLIFFAVVAVVVYRRLPAFRRA